MPAPKKNRNTTPFLFNAELDRFNEFKEVCHREKRSVQEKLNELIVQTIETNGIGENNPLGITYGPPIQQKITSFKAENPLVTLDLFINNGIIGLKQWQPAFAEVEDQEQMQRYVNLTDIMFTTAKNRLSYLKTGKAVVISGREIGKGTRSGF